MSGITFTPAERLKMRGYCAGPQKRFPPPGTVGLDYSADCPECGKRVKVTKRGLYANHKPMDAASPLPEHPQRPAEPVGMDAIQATELLTQALMTALANSTAAAQARGELTESNLANIAKAAGCNAAMALMTDEE